MHNITSPRATDSATEQAIKAAGADKAPRITPADVEANIVSVHYFTARDGVLGATIQSGAAVNRFLTWPVPASVYPDGTPGKPGRTGTNLLTALEARAMLDHVSAAAETSPSLGRLTFCILVLRNGSTVTGESACASPENFNAEIGRRIARENAVAKVWPLMGYELRTELARPRLTEADAAADLAGTPRPDNPTRS